RLTSIRRPFASTTSRAQVFGSLRSTLVRVTLTSTNGLPSPCPPTSLRRLLSPRCKVLNAKPCLWQNSLCRSPLDSNSNTSRLISRRLRRFPTLTTSLSVMPTVHQKRARSTRWVRLTETLERRYVHVLAPILFAQKNQGIALLQAAIGSGEFRADVDVQVTQDALYGGLYYRLLTGLG